MADLDKMIEEIEKMTVLELNDLVKKIEEKFGVSAAAMAVAAPAAGGCSRSGRADRVHGSAQRSRTEQNPRHQGCA